MKLLPESLDLHVQGLVSAQDAERQARTAQEILRRFDGQPGVVLGDEVGMGKTFVALAVAAAQVLSDVSRPVVVMVPANVLSKWERDANTFSTACLRDPKDRARFRVRVSETGVGFLKLLDDPPQQRATVILLGHGALHRKMADKWVKLATLQAAIKGRHGADSLRHRVARFAGMLLGTAQKPDHDYELYKDLLETSTSDWLEVLSRRGQPPKDGDNPVPEAFASALEAIDLTPLFRTLCDELPEKSSANIKTRIQNARAALEHGDPRSPAGQRGSIADVWDMALKRNDLSFPLLILDEAHRVRHGGTQLASLLRSRNEELDVAGGQLAHRFDRMLFLTATPFQLGHQELINILGRFDSVRWNGRRTPAMTREEFLQTVQDLRTALDDMQGKTERLERAWKQLLPADLDQAVQELGDQWWAKAAEQPIQNERLKSLGLAYRAAEQAVRLGEGRLKPWLLRHQRSTHLPAPYSSRQRRVRVEGQAVQAEAAGAADRLPVAAAGGLKVRGAAALPFMLSARLATLPKTSRVFNEGLASSYAAMLETSADGDVPTPVDDGATASSVDERERKRADWYMQRLRDAAPRSGMQALEAHPKMKATVDLAMSIWSRGEKVLIFAHYRKTGQALLEHLSLAMHRAIEVMGAKNFGCPPDQVGALLESMQSRLDKSGSPYVAARVNVMLDAYPPLQDAPTVDLITSVVRRFMRTETFLVRFGATTEGTEVAEWIADMFSRQDDSGMTLEAMVNQFLQSLSRMPDVANRTKVLEALDTIQTGSHTAASALKDTDADDDEARSFARVPNVVRVHGGTNQEAKDRRVLAFNTPFYPEILIASSVLEEGVDLHQNCRHIIHHDLDWNPSTLEQRTGRVDRLGSKAERSGHSIRVYLPYIEGCQDEKLFRVVMDRERWFGVVMGAEQSMARVLEAKPWEIEKMAEALPVPLELVASLSMNSLATDANS